MIDISLTNLILIVIASSLVVLSGAFIYFGAKRK
ncbi:MAG: hypothetical protein CEO21_424 [Microgenomates group bacterium Gr01-1014_80]|nr:MAG: hypothetical protein CEO21_424 [Microgenomates group bacterium Gr01-1014_80]